MIIKSLISDSDEPSIKSLLTSARLVACDQNDGLPLWIKCKDSAPSTVIRIKTQFLHIAVF